MHVLQQNLKRNTAVCSCGQTFYRRSENLIKILNHGQ